MSEEGATDLVLDSRKPEARRFRADAAAISLFTGGSKKGPDAEAFVVRSRLARCPLVLAKDTEGRVHGLARRKGSPRLSGTRHTMPRLRGRWFECMAIRRGRGGTNRVCELPGFSRQLSYLWRRLIEGANRRGDQWPPNHPPPQPYPPTAASPRGRLCNVGWCPDMPIKHYPADTVSGIAPDVETVIVPPVTQCAPGFAWSAEDGYGDTQDWPEADTINNEPETELVPAGGRSWARAGSYAAIIGLVPAGLLILVCGFPWDWGTHSDITTSNSVGASPLPASAPPPISSEPIAPSPSPVAARPDDDEFVAIAISPSALSTGKSGGFGTSGTQQGANIIALSECLTATGHNDCVLVNTGMFHGCVSYAIDGDRWAGGVGNSASDAKEDAQNHLGIETVRVAVHCSTPPGNDPTPTVTVTQTPAAAPPRTASPATTPAEAPRPDRDRQYLADLRAAGITITDPVRVAGNGPRVCAYIAAGHTEQQAVETAMAGNPTLTRGNAITVVDAAITIYCPEQN